MAVIEIYATHWRPTLPYFPAVFNWYSLERMCSLLENRGFVSQITSVCGGNGHPIVVPHKILQTKKQR